MFHFCSGAKKGCKTVLWEGGQGTLDWLAVLPRAGAESSSFSRNAVSGGAELPPSWIQSVTHSL